MRKFKKVLAIGMALTMILGSSLAAFADEPATSGSTSGIGTSEGHVEEKATNVVLPTITEGTTPFAYTMDPEGLIQETAGEKYGETTEFPEANVDKHVYFNNGKKGGEGDDKDNIVYKNTSPKLKVENQSSYDIDLTVSVTASTAATDIPLVAQAALEDASEASLYLGLKVDSEAAVAVTTSAAASKTVRIAGTPGNFKIAYNSDKGYEYRVLTLAEYKAKEGNENATELAWSSSEFSLEGEVTTEKKITSTTTAPTVSVTWSWTDPSAEPEVVTPSITTTTATATSGNDTEIVFVGTAEDIADIKFNTTSVMNKVEITDGKITVLSSWTDAWSAGMSRELTVYFSDETTGTFTVTKE